MIHVFTLFLIAATLATAPRPTMAQETAGKPGTVAPHQDSAFGELEGVWVADKFLSSGKTVPKEKIVHEYHFKRPNRLVRKGITVGNVTGKDGEDVVTLDSSQKPAAMNLRMNRRGEIQTTLAIYKIEGDSLTICFLRDERGRPSSERPIAFFSDEATRSDLIVFKRKREASESSQEPSLQIDGKIIHETVEAVAAVIKAEYFDSVTAERVSDALHERLAQDRYANTRSLEHLADNLTRDYCT